MARLPRFVLPCHPQHVIVRGNNRDPIFCANEDYRFCLDKLRDAASKYQCDIHAYVLMTNHVHLLVTPHAEDGISKMIQMLGRYYVQYFNYTYRRSGTLWEGRYKASLIESEAYALTCYRYIELNPVRANMVDHPADYPWSSYRGNALGTNDELLTPHSLFLALGISTEERQAAYRALFETHLDGKTLDEVRSSINKAWVLGSEHFKNMIETQLNRRTSPIPKGGDRKSVKYINGVPVGQDSIDMFNRV
ncbi:MAG: transposase [Rhodocyclaceae bacterium]|nr:transposase [Rhodocyclaceae bacterium]